METLLRTYIYMYLVVPPIQAHLTPEFLGSTPLHSNPSYPQSFGQHSSPILNPILPPKKIGQHFPPIEPNFTPQKIGQHFPPI